MKLALDPQMFYATSSVYELPDIVASLGYDWMELSPKADFIPFFRYPRVDDAGVQKLKKIASDAGVGIASVLPLQRWAGPDEEQRQAYPFVRPAPPTHVPPHLYRGRGRPRWGGTDERVRTTGGTLPRQLRSCRKVVTSATKRRLVKVPPCPVPGYTINRPSRTPSAVRWKISVE